MTLRYFEIFLAVCRTGSMTQAGHELYMTQPSVSQAIAALEAHYGVPLFERLGRRLFLTVPGKQLQIYAGQILDSYHRMEANMRAFQAEATLQVGASVTIGETLLIPVLKTVRQQLAPCRIRSEIHNTEELEEMIEKADLDVAMVEGAVRSPHLVRHVLTEDPMVLVTSPSYDLPSALQPDDFPILPFFIREAGSGTRQVFEETMARHGLSYQVAGVYNNTASIVEAVIAGLGAAVLSQRLVASAVKEGQLQQHDIAGVSFSRIFQLIYHEDKHMSPLFQQFIQICQAMARQREV